ncbi:DNA photolyase, FAD-binding/Cryptochrome [Lentinula aciculospora]|uniref:DNA photolyase, FAD-binding/Cryptochrome n=1 Tax=Lentinula aciculospora TaxID=153920 RepID=A0A9W9DP39_9AGAR|nr:DNA photolyase, FAD-binding/Cryptochrome [Lentinula aciculospora]
MLRFFVSLKFRTKNTLALQMPPKRARDISSSSDAAKRPRAFSSFAPRKVATAKNAAAVDADPPLGKLSDAVKNQNQKVKKGDAVVYWMKIADLRISDNHALSLASAQAKKEEIPLIVLFVISPQDYKAHDRGPRRIDFTLRNLTIIKDSLADLNIPLYLSTHNVRKTLPAAVLSILEDWNCTSIHGNIEYEVDELRRDTEFCRLAKTKSVRTNFVHNKCIIEPGVVTTKENKAYSVYSPYQRKWISILNDNLDHYLKDFPGPHSNADGIREDPKFSKLFRCEVPKSVPGFELEFDDKKTMESIWPAGEEVARQILDRFLHTKSRASQMGAVDPLAEGAEISDKASRIIKYGQDRDSADRDTTSRLSPYLSAGVISIRECVRATLKFQKSKKVDGSRDTGIGRWVQELAWRDFYTGVLVSFPRVSMGRPFLEKYAAVEWEAHQEVGAGGGSGGKGYIDNDPDPVGQGKDAEVLRRWKEGMTGVPVVDAAMRCIKKMGWVHNRFRMITAMYLTKDLMVEWRVGERYFMENLIDGDLASNNGGWQWSASTGVDPCPYFRIFNPYTQSTKVDPTGDFIREFVPELAKLQGSDLHNPSTSVADKLGYPRPIISHEEGRQRALKRFKEAGAGGK